ncbi:MAG TPA: folate-binding protein [Marinobacter sp.]|nr:folate-binding protein [Marinobacter sp.]
MNNRVASEYQGYAVLGNRIMVRISGPGTDKFVQGQFSQQVDDITPRQSRRATVNTPKGRAYALTRLVRDGDDLLMDLDRELADATLSQLRKYLMLFRGTTMEIVEGAEFVGLIGTHSALATVGEQAGRLDDNGDVLATNPGYLIRIEDTPDGVARYEWWLPEGGSLRPDGVPELSTRQWEAASIAAGVPWLTPQTVEAYVPQMLNLQHLQGVHFKKGCYTGQEVIARMHFLGQLKKSLYRLSFSGCHTAPAPGTIVRAGEAKAGEVVNAAMTAENAGEMLAVLRHDADMATLRLAENADVRLGLLPLPYPVPEREASAAQG